MKKKPKEKNWELDSGFELRKVDDCWGIFEGGGMIAVAVSLEDARSYAQNLRKQRNCEQ